MPNPTPLHPTVLAVTERIRQRSALHRSAYLAQVDAAANRKPGAERMGCANVAHAFAAMPSDDKARVTGIDGAQHRHRHRLQRHAVGPPAVRGLPGADQDEARRHGATAQVAGGVPAMCDGVTQGTAGHGAEPVQRDTIAMATAMR
jgi:phosphogluconate dehydratase